MIHYLDYLYHCHHGVHSIWAANSKVVHCAIWGVPVKFAEKLKFLFGFLFNPTIFKDLVAGFPTSLAWMAV